MDSIETICNSFFDVPLAQDGFSRVHVRRWVRAAKAPIREIFEVQAMKASRYSIRWGFSIDFVPLYGNGKLSWKRTDKSARFDLCIDPIDEAGNVPDWCAFEAPAFNELLQTIGLSRPQPPRLLAEIASETLSKAKADFASVVTLRDLRGMFARRSEMKFKRFGLNNYIQTDLARGLLFTVTGQADLAEEHLARFCARFDLSRLDPLITKALLDARKWQHVTAIAGMPGQ